MALTFTCPQYPTHAGELIFHRYEGVASATKAQYRYWAYGGMAGAVLRGHRVVPCKPGESDTVASVRSQISDREITVERLKV